MRRKYIINSLLGIPHFFFRPNSFHETIYTFLNKKISATKIHRIYSKKRLIYFIRNEYFAENSKEKRKIEYIQNMYPVFNLNFICAV